MCDTLRTVEKAERLRRQAKLTAHWFREPFACMAIMSALGVKMLRIRVLEAALLWLLVMSTEEEWMASSTFLLQAYMTKLRLRELASTVGRPQESETKDTCHGPMETHLPVSATLVPHKNSLALLCTAFSSVKN